MVEQPVPLIEDPQPDHRQTHATGDHRHVEGEPEKRSGPSAHREDHRRDSQAQHPDGRHHQHDEPTSVLHRGPERLVADQSMVVFESNEPRLAQLDVEEPQCHTVNQWPEHERDKRNRGRQQEHPPAPSEPRHCLDRRAAHCADSSPGWSTDCVLANWPRKTPSASRSNPASASAGVFRPRNADCRYGGIRLRMS